MKIEIDHFYFGDELFSRKDEKTPIGYMGVFRSGKSLDIFFDTEAQREVYFGFLKIRDGIDRNGNHREFSRLGIFDTSEEIESHFRGPFIYGIKSTKSKIIL